MTESTIAVFDWDDTLMATTFVLGDLSFTELLAREVTRESCLLPELSSSLINLLIQVFLFCDKVYIVTNATREWVNFCMRMYLKDSFHMFSGIQIISTVDNGFATGEFAMWKCHVYEELFKLYQNDNHHVVFVGDSPNDKMASMYIASVYKNLIVKHVSMNVEPTLYELIIQQREITKNFLKFVLENENTTYTFKNGTFVSCRFLA